MITKEQHTINLEELQKTLQKLQEMTERTICEQNLMEQTESFIEYVKSLQAREDR